ncbi:MAG TPA: aminotransferase class I/II-fold pyridoxal phosphate-dependent enzyme [Methanospirillum sp.]|nr:aminotransferase class I/II-fold pyridoxal phosphate-dependent enzyme [Methanospirillum sp.]
MAQENSHSDNATLRTGGFKQSVIREMTRLAVKNNAINLAQGFPDFEAPDILKKAACDSILNDHNQYAITWGVPELRQALSEKIITYSKQTYDPEQEITITCGSTEAMIACLLGLTSPDDEIVICEPYYENYVPDTYISGAKPVYVPLNDDLSISEDDLSSAFSSRTRAVILNTPNNPTGKVFSREELSMVRDLCVDYDTFAFVDEIYEHIVFDGNHHVSLSSLDGMSDRTVTIGSFSKTYSVTGWRVGYTLAKASLTDEIRKIHDFLTVGAPAPLQHACVTACKLPSSYYYDLAQMYTQKREILYQGLKSAGFPCEKPHGAYYLFTDIEKFDMDDLTFARYLVEEIGVAVVPGSSFFRTGGSNKVRFTFSKKEQTLHEACDRLEKLNDGI